MNQAPHASEEQAAAARLRVVLDSKLGRPTPPLVRSIAASGATPPTGPAHPLLEALGVELDAELLTQALTHRSYAYEHERTPNERLEFLGDAVLGIVVTDHLYRMNPEFTEGQLAKARASVVNMRELADVARGLSAEGLGSHLLLSSSEEQAGARDKDAVLADGLEALLGAVYLQHGIDVSRKLVHKLFDPLLANARSGYPGDWQAALRALTASIHLGPPEYHIEASGPAGPPEFTATVMVAGQERGTAVGATKREAVQKAAEAAWRSLQDVASPRPATGG